MSHLLEVRDGTHSTMPERIEAAIAQAHQAKELYGAMSKECVVAWDIVEELHAAAAHQRAKSFFDQHCVQYPSASECLIYDI